jgi:hypothetical protein
VPGESAMWNSGVIGLRASQRAILADTVDLIDTLFPICPIHTIEQVALSLILQDRQLPVRTCDAEVLHYHTFKEFRGDLARFFEHYQGAGTERLLQGWADIDPSLRIVPKREFNALARFADHSRETFDAVLDTCERIAREKYAPFNRLVDTQEPLSTARRSSCRRPPTRPGRPMPPPACSAPRRTTTSAACSCPTPWRRRPMPSFSMASVSIGSGMLTTGNANLLMVHGTELQKQVFALNEFPAAGPAPCA